MKISYPFRPKSFTLAASGDTGRSAKSLWIPAAVPQYFDGIDSRMLVHHGKSFKYWKKRGKRGKMREGGKEG